MKIKNSKIAKSRAGLIIDHPFFAALLLPMPFTEDNSIPTMATDGESIIYNADFTNSLTDAETTFVLAHETMHCVFDHMGRRESRSPNRWNQAADYIINQLLIDEKIGTMPKGGLYDRDLVARGKDTAEGVYKLIPAENENKKSGDKGGSLDHVFDAGTKLGKLPTDGATLAEKSANLKVRIIQGKNAAKMCGKLSKALERIIDDFVKPVIDWKAELRRFVSERAKVELTFARPKRRFLGEDLYLPSLGGQKMGFVVVAVDVSGSVDTRLLTAFGSEINALREDVKPSRVDVVYFDSKVCHTETFNPDDELVLRPVGGGGTDFAPVFEHIATLDEQPVAVIVLTDLVCDSFGHAPECPVLWAVLEGCYGAWNKVPFGEILKVEGE